MFELMDAYSQNAVIKVLGVGGGGGNAVETDVDLARQPGALDGEIAQVEVPAGDPSRVLQVGQFEPGVTDLGQDSEQDLGRPELGGPGPGLGGATGTAGAAMLYGVDLAIVGAGGTARAIAAAASSMCTAPAANAVSNSMAPSRAMNVSIANPIWAGLSTSRPMATSGTKTTPLVRSVGSDCSSP